MRGQFTLPVSTWRRRMLLGLNFRPFTAVGIVAAHPPRSGPHPASSPRTKPLACHIVAFESPPARLPDTPCPLHPHPSQPQGDRSRGGGLQEPRLPGGRPDHALCAFHSIPAEISPRRPAQRMACMRPGLSCFPDSRVPDSHFHFLDRLPNK